MKCIVINKQQQLNTFRCKFNKPLKKFLYAVSSFFGSDVFATKHQRRSVVDFVGEDKRLKIEALLLLLLTALLTVLTRVISLR